MRKKLQKEINEFNFFFGKILEVIFFCSKVDFVEQFEYGNEFWCKYKFDAEKS